MFGYIGINRSELKVRDLEQYQSFYCGLCHSLKHRGGRIGQMTLTYDMTFLTLLLAGLYEGSVTEILSRCPTRPWKRIPKLTCRESSYAADMNILLAAYNLEDDWLDDRSLKGLLMYRLLRRQCLRIEREYPRQAAAVREYLIQLHQCESSGAADLDLAAGLTGKMLAEIFVCSEDIWSEELRHMGFFLGKFIYLMDAYEDYDDDKRSGNYNPWAAVYAEHLPDDVALQILTMMMAEVTRAFERLPILLYGDLLRNILYSGVWGRYEEIRKKRSGTQLPPARPLQENSND